MNNNKKSFIERMLVFSLVYLVAWTFLQKYWTGRNAAPAQPAKTLVQAWTGIAPGNGTKLTPTQATTELSALQKSITGNNGDDYSYWARLRSGLIQQYGLTGKTDIAAARKSYEEVINHGASDDVDAQALYQDGDSLWREGRPAPNQIPQGDKLSTAAFALEKLIHRGRGSSVFLEKKIYVPSEGGTDIGAPKLDATTLPTAFTLISVADLSAGTLDPQVSILRRVDDYYTTTPQSTVFTTVAKALGNDPKFSYGLAIVLFAVFTRVLMQPLTRKQYESMKGMAVIAPEMKKIQDRYKGKTDQATQMKMMGEIRELQKKHGVNPSLGCALMLPSALLFIFIVSPFIQHNESHLQLVNASFGWIQNLARPDIPLLVMYILSQFLSIRLSSTTPTDAQQRQMQMISTFTPIIFGYFLLNYPSAFTLYWMTYNVLSTGFQWRLLKQNDPTKSFYKTLTANPFALAQPVDGVVETAVPARPKPLASKTHVKTLNPGEAVPARPNASANGKVTSNGKAATNGKAVDSESGLNGTLNGTSSAFSNGSAGQSDLGGDENGSALNNGSALDEETPANGTSKNGTNANRNTNSQRARQRRRH